MNIQDINSRFQESLGVGLIYGRDAAARHFASAFIGHECEVCGRELKTLDDAMDCRRVGNTGLIHDECLSGLTPNEIDERRKDGGKFVARYRIYDRDQDKYRFTLVSFVRAIEQDAQQYARECSNQYETWTFTGLQS